MYKHIVAGGTFDDLHQGHTHFLEHVYASGARVTLGLTSESYIRKYKRGRGVRAYSLRYKALTTWLRRQGWAARTTIVPLHDAYGPTLLPDGFDAIAVTADNKHVARQINILRKERGLGPLSIVAVDLVVAADNKPISSTRVRKGEIDRKGKLLMPEGLRPELQQPMGALLSKAQIPYSVLHNRDNVLITVGDVTTQTVFSFGVQPSLVIIDLHVERKPYQSLTAYKFPKKYVIKHIQSGPGFIATRAVKAIQQWRKNVKKRTILVIEGEEDLLAIPAIIHAPSRSIVYYGSPSSSGKEGLVEVKVDRATQEQAKKLFRQFI
jgi:pantetheine-phosphate adenylyltransferase